ncbi:hypothetical protein ACV3UL_07820 [Clostridium perfringens]
MKMYHVSKDIYDKVTIFTPKVPDYLLKNEDNKIKRICVGRSIQDCLNGLCYDTNISNKLFNDNQTCYELLGECYRVMKVYEFDVPDELVFNHHYVSSFVPDAMETKENWLKHTVKPTDEYLINITGYSLNINGYIENINFEYVEEDFYSKCIISGFNKSSYTDLREAACDMTIDVNFTESSLELDLTDFPCNKDMLKECLKTYFSFEKCEVELI